ncbi:MAG: cysteine desulfurase, partial [Oscillospiraceae bacterium]|nr:cysteine desulfurase [Oscillospiraceae bacterium]
MEPRTVYADNAAATRLSEEALAAMLPFCTEQYANPSSQYPFAAAAKKALESARETLAGLLGACPDEIVFTSGGTESDNLAVLGAVRAAPRGKRHLIVSAVEHPAVLRAAERLSREGCSVTVLPVDGTGRVSPAGLAAAMRPDTALVSVMTANNEVGTVQPVEELAAVARRGGALFHTDAAQAAGQLALDVRRTGVDLMSLSAHKFNGPKGAGLLFVRRGTPVERLFEGGGQELGRRGGTENVPGAVGM